MLISLYLPVALLLQALVALSANTDELVTPSDATENSATGINASKATANRWWRRTMGFPSDLVKDMNVWLGAASELTTAQVAAQPHACQGQDICASARFRQGP